MAKMTTNANLVPHGDSDRQPCGWFDSSFELRNGLSVTVHESMEALQRIERWVRGERPLPVHSSLRNAVRPAQPGSHHNAGVLHQAAG